MRRIILFMFLGFLTPFTQAQSLKEPIVLIETSYGNMKVKLYNETPKHRDNFLKLAKEGFYDSTLFHRVIEGFMIQGGDPKSKGASKGESLGTGGPGYTIDAEIVPSLFHKKGALAAARMGDNVNPLKASSGSQFYIVQGRPASTEQLDSYEKNRNQALKNEIFNEILSKPENARIKKMIDGYIKVGNQKEYQFLMQQIAPTIEQEVTKRGTFSYSDAERNIYSSIGGTPHLDGAYTVFGEVIEGLDVIDKIAATNTNSSSRPEVDIRMVVKILQE